jgi:hypothetical protein
MTEMNVCPGCLGRRVACAGVGVLVLLTPPTAEQESYLRKIERSGKYDPEVIIVGRERAR